MKRIFFGFTIVLVLVFGLKVAFASKLISSPPVANSAISGQVTDFTTGESLAGVAVNIQGTDIKTYTDLDGNFQFDKVFPGSYNLVFSFISYNKSLVEELEVEPTEKNAITVKLQEAL